MLHRGSYCLLAQPMDGHIMRCGIISSFQSAATSEIVKRSWVLYQVSDVFLSVQLCCFHQVGFDGVIFTTDECYTESGLENWGTSQTSVWKHCRSCCWKSRSWISFSAGSAFFVVNAFCFCITVKLWICLHGRRTGIRCLLSFLKYRCVA